MNFRTLQHSIVESDKIGKHTHIGSFVHVLPMAIVGENCEIDDHVYIENGVIVGNRVTIKCGVQLWDGVRIEDDVFIGPNVTFTNNIFPRSKQYPGKLLDTHVRSGASIGANATILPGITIGKNAMVGAGAVVTRDVPPNAIAVGNPSYITGYVSKSLPEHLIKSETPIQKSDHKYLSNVKGATIYNLPVIMDMRGNLSFAEYGQYLPFIPKRYFIVFDVASKEIRGEHAHRTLHQFLICVKGSCSLVVDDGYGTQEINLEKPNIGVHIEPMVWGIQYKYSSDAVLLVLASDVYKADDYIRDYDEFLKELKLT